AMVTPSRMVPFLPPRSRTRVPAAVTAISQWKGATVASASERSLLGCEPIDSRVSADGCGPAAAPSSTVSWKRRTLHEDAPSADEEPIGCILSRPARVFAASQSPLHD